jgi:uncharacterized NAD(P)/FAD-binding protein YdhS
MIHYQFIIAGGGNAGISVASQLLRKIKFSKELPDITRQLFEFFFPG